MAQPRLEVIALSDIRENPVALRAVNRQSEEFKNLVSSIQNQGILNPINVRVKNTGKGGLKDGKHYEIIDGLHRYTGALEAGLTEIPAQVFEMEDADALAAQIVGNFHRVQTRPAEYTRGLLRILSANPQMTISDLAAMLSVAPTFIDQRLSLTKLDPKIAELVDSGQINLSNAFPLAKLPTDEQASWVERAMTMGAGEFAPQVRQRQRELEQARRAGREAEPESFKPTPHLRKLSEIKAEFQKPAAGPALISTNNITDPNAAFALAVAWALTMDPVGQASQVAADAARKERAKTEKLQREEERKAKRAQEAQTKQAELIKEAEAARKAREDAGLPPLQTKPTDHLQPAEIGAGLTLQST